MASRSKWAQSNQMDSLSLEHWPYFTKDFVRDEAENLLTVSKKFCIKASTSGSTGIPINLYRSPKSVSQEQAAIDFVCEKGKLDMPNEVIGLFRGDNIKDVNDHSTIFHKKVGPDKIVFSSSHLTRENIKVIFDTLKSEKVTVVMGYPSAIEELCRLGANENLKLDLKGFVTSSEVLTMQSRSLFKKIAPEASIVDYYGLAERMIFSYSIDGLEHFFLFGYAHVEIIFEYSDDQFDYYEAAGTSFINDHMPFVRYKTGDLIKVKKGSTEEELEEVCLGLKPFYGIEGRTVDYLITESGERLVGMTFIPRGVDNIHRLQIIQSSPKEVIINVLKKENYSGSDEETIINNARTKIPESINISVNVVNELSKNKSGKTPYVIHNF